MLTLSHAQKDVIGLSYVLGSLAPVTPYGAKRLRTLAPFVPGQEEELALELKNVGLARQGYEKNKRPYDELTRIMTGVKDITRSLEACASGALTQVELFEVKRFLMQLERLCPLFEQLDTGFSGIALTALTPALDLLDIDGRRLSAFSVSDGYSPQLAHIRKQKRELEDELRKAAGDQRAFLLQKRTVIAAEESAEEKKVLARLSQALRPYLDGLLANALSLGRLDLTLQKALLALKYSATPAQPGPVLELVECTNPRVADSLAQAGRCFAPVSIGLVKGATAITGANMGGKSVALYTVALNAWLNQHGFFVFAQQGTLPLFSSLHLQTEDGQSVDKGLSSFGAEVVGLCAAFDKAKAGGALVILDEPARGTNPDEGRALVMALTQAFNACGSFTLLTTHYDGVAELAAAHYQVMGLRRMDVNALMGVVTPDLQGVSVISRYMDYGLVKAADQKDCPRDAINICRLLGLDENILSRAQKIIASN